MRKSQMNRGVFLSLIVLLAATTQCLAQSRQGTTPSTPTDSRSNADPLLASAQKWDANHDGVYTCAEWKAYAGRLFNLAAKHNRNAITKDEFEVIRRADPIFADADFSYFDSNGDGQIDRQEFVDAPSPFFLRYDTKGTCSVSAADLNPQPAQSAKGPGKSGGRGMGMGMSGQ
jgi:hypothetical protein